MLDFILSAINFIDWFSFLNFDVTIQGVTLPLSEWCAQYSCVQTNYVMTLGGLFSIIILLIKRNKKWWWYTFFAILTVTSITSVGMHTANYGEFESGVITTKLVGSYIDMSFTIFTAWAGVCCFIFEFCENKNKRPFAFSITAWTAVVILALTIETFVFKDRPLFIFGGGKAMDGASGGMSLAELSCFLTAFPLLFIVIFNAKKLDKTELGIVSFVIAIFVVGLAVSNVYGDNQINSMFLGNIHTHSMYHILNGMGTFTAVIWVDYRTQKQLSAAKEDKFAKLNQKMLLNDFALKPEIVNELAADEVEYIVDKSKKNLRSWKIVASIAIGYIALTLILGIIAAIKGAAGAYSDFSYDKFHFLYVTIIMLAGLLLISPVILFNYYKAKKAYKNDMAATE